MGLPDGFSGLGIQGLDKTTDTKLSTRHADNDFAIHRQGSQGHIIAGQIVLELFLPHHRARFRIQGDHIGIDRSEIDFVTVQGDATIGRMQLEQVFG